jgi:hypothetical protein
MKNNEVTTERAALRDEEGAAAAAVEVFRFAIAIIGSRLGAAGRSLGGTKEAPFVHASYHCGSRKPRSLYQGYRLSQPIQRLLCT